MDKKTRNLIMLLGAVLIVVCVCAAGLLLIPEKNGSATYADTISLAQEYYDKGNYEYAIKYFKEAIKIDPDDESAYRRLGETYIKIGDTDSAISIWKRGFKATGSERLELLINKYSVEVIDDPANAESDADKKNDKDSERAGINRELMKMFSEYTFADYEGEYGEPSYSQSYGKCNVNHKELSADFEYYDSEEAEKQLDDDGYPLEQSIPNSISLKDVSVLFDGWKDGFGINDMQNIGLTGLHITQADDRSVVEFKYSGCTVQIECDNSGRILSAAAWNKITPQQKEKENENGRDFTIDVIVATTGAHIEEEYIVQVAHAEDVVSGDDQPLGVADNIIGEYSTSNGVLNVTLPDGEYAVCVYPVSAPERFTRYKWVIDDETDDSDLKIVVMDSSAAGKVTIVLRWGDTPRDLDSHLVGEGIHVSFMDMHKGEDISLDVDCMQGNGIETITMDETDGSYTYYVKNYSGESPISSSGATVEVFTDGSTSPQVFTVPAGIDDVWEVFTITDGVITPINREGEDISGDDKDW